MCNRVPPEILQQIIEDVLNVYIDVYICSPRALTPVDLLAIDQTQTQVGQSTPGYEIPAARTVSGGIGDTNEQSCTARSDIDNPIKQLLGTNWLTREICLKALSEILACDLDKTGIWTIDPNPWFILNTAHNAYQEMEYFSDQSQEMYDIVISKSPTLNSYWNEREVRRMMQDPGLFGTPQAEPVNSLSGARIELIILRACSINKLNELFEVVRSIPSYTRKPIFNRYLRTQFDVLFECNIAAHLLILPAILTMLLVPDIPPIWAEDPNSVMSFFEMDLPSSATEGFDLRTRFFNLCPIYLSRFATKCPFINHYDYQWPLDSGDTEIAIKYLTDAISMFNFVVNFIVPDRYKIAWTEHLKSAQEMRKILNDCLQQISPEHPPVHMFEDAMELIAAADAAELARLNTQ